MLYVSMLPCCRSLPKRSHYKLYDVNNNVRRLRLRDMYINISFFFFSFIHSCWTPHLNSISNWRRHRHIGSRHVFSCRLNFNRKRLPFHAIAKIPFHFYCLRCKTIVLWVCVCVFLCRKHRWIIVNRARQCGPSAFADAGVVVFGVQWRYDKS